MKRVNKQNGFTLIELLVVIAIIALLLSIIMPALGRAKIYAQKILCINDTRQQALGAILYSNDNDSAVPRTEVASGSWLWDMSFKNTSQLSDYAGFDDNETFFCAANKIKKAEDARFWQYRWLEVQNLGENYAQLVPLRNESKLKQSQLESYYRVLPMIYMFDRFDSEGNSWFSDRLITGEKAHWIIKLSDLQSASSQEMIMDAVISANAWNFYEIYDGGIDELSEGTLWDNTNHLSRQTIHSGSNAGPKPEGANVAFADGHAEWRPFSVMKHRYTQGMWFWW